MAGRFEARGAVRMTPRAADLCAVLAQRLGLDPTVVVPVLLTYSLHYASTLLTGEMRLEDQPVTKRPGVVGS